MVIGQASLFNNSEITEMAKKAGDPEKFEVCDLDAACGQVMLAPYEVKDLFIQKDGTPYDAKLINESLEFIKDYYFKKDSAEKILKDPKYIGHFALLLKDIFPKISRLHAKYDIPMFETEHNFFLEIMRRAMSNEKEYSECLKEVCGDTDFSNELFEVYVNGLLQAGLIVMAKPEAVGLILKYLKVCRDISSGGKKTLFNDPLVQQVLAKFEDAAVEKLIGKKVVFPKGAARGKNATVVFLWATHCSYCKSAIPYLAQVKKSLEKKGINVVGMTPVGDDKEVIDKLLKESAVKWGNFEVGEAYYTELAGKGIPTFLITDKNGVVVKMLRGFTANQPHNFEKIARESKLIK